MKLALIVLPYQQSWVPDDSRVKVYEKSWRIGVSWAEAGDDAPYAANAANQDVWYIGYNKDMARQFIDSAGVDYRTASALVRPSGARGRTRGVGNSWG